ncbi:MAG: hypothetical protein R6X32_05995 [Chloroflexota bacterium]
MYTMYTNGRSYIRTTDHSRAATWQRIFGTDRLPVRADQPRWICDRAGERLVYDLDMSQMPGPAVHCLAAHVARLARQPYMLVLSDIESRGFWVDAADCWVEEETAVDKRPFFLYPDFVGGYAYA